LRRAKGGGANDEDDVVKRVVTFTIAAVGMFVIAGPVAAEPLRLAQNARLLPAYEIKTIVRSVGLDPIGPAMRRGRNYVMRAIDDAGREVRVVVDARYGEVISVAPVMVPPPYGPRPGIARVPPPDYDGPPPIYGVPSIYEDEPPPRPPRVVNRLPSAALIKPRRPPLPRPRPAEASLAATTATTPTPVPAPAAKAAPGTELQKTELQKTESEKTEPPKKKEVEVPAVAPLDSTAHGPIPN